MDHEVPVRAAPEAVQVFGMRLTVSSEEVWVGDGRH
jgi:hypothetical protein